MADVLIVDKSKDESGRVSLLLNSGRKTAFVSFRAGACQPISVCCQNASHRAWRGLGRDFRNWAEAREAYKSADMRAIIGAAESEFSDCN